MADLDRIRILIVENEGLVGCDLASTLSGLGYEVCGIGRTVAEAIALGLQHRPDLAVIDLRLADGGFGTDIVSGLAELEGLGVLYATGNMSSTLLSDADGDACLAKPYRSSDLLRSLEIVIDIRAQASVMPPFPRGFQLLRAAQAARQGRRHG